MAVKIELNTEELDDIQGALSVYGGLLGIDHVPIDRLREKILSEMGDAGNSRSGQKYFIVVKQLAGSGPLKWFTSGDEAYQFASEMAGKYPGTVYQVLASVRAVRAWVAPAIIEDLA